MTTCEHVTRDMPAPPTNENKDAQAPFSSHTLLCNLQACKLYFTFTMSNAAQIDILRLSTDDGTSLAFMDLLPRHAIHRKEGSLDLVTLPRGTILWRAEGLEQRAAFLERSYSLMSLAGAMMAQHHGMPLRIEGSHPTLVAYEVQEDLFLIDLNSAASRETLNAIAPRIVSGTNIKGTIALATGVATTSFAIGSPLFLALLLPIAALAYAVVGRAGDKAFPKGKLPTDQLADRVSTDRGASGPSPASIQDNVNSIVSQVVCGIPKTFMLHGFTYHKELPIATGWHRPPGRTAEGATGKAHQDFHEVFLCPAPLDKDALAPLLRRLRVEDMEASAAAHVRATFQQLQKDLKREAPAAPPRAAALG